MKVLLAASECSPFIKVGGIADVIGSLPIALKGINVDIRVTIPFYKPLLQTSIQTAIIHEQSIHYAGKDNTIEVHETKIPNTNILVYLIYNQDYLSSGGVYSSPKTMPSSNDELERFAFFSKCISDMFSYPNKVFTPDIIHCNDWHTGIVPQIIQSTHLSSNSSRPKTIFTIHNLAYQGFSKLDVIDKLDMNTNSDQSLKWDSQDNNIDFVLQGIIGADFVTTVSEKYAKEIQTPEFGEGLHDILKAREGRLQGILNGISYEVFDPAKDPYISVKYSLGGYESGKKQNKEQLKKDFGLAKDSNKPLIGIVSRLAYQKGLDLVAESLPDIVELGYQVVLLGTGDPRIEKQFQAYANDDSPLKGSFTPKITFSEEAARKIYASSDMFLIPSRFEPSGLTQMIAMKYGSVPVVRATGGLYDTVENGVTGFTFVEFSKSAMLGALEDAILQYRNADKWRPIVTKCMTQDFSWTNSAKKYLQLYNKVLEG